MDWSELYGADNRPTPQDISGFIQSDLWRDMDGFFIALVVIGAREEAETELLMPLCSAYTQELYRQIVFSADGRWLMMNVTDEKILEDAKSLIKLRVNPK